MSPSRTSAVDDIGVIYSPSVYDTDKGRGYSSSRSHDVQQQRPTLITRDEPDTTQRALSARLRTMAFSSSTPGIEVAYTNTSVAETLQCIYSWICVDPEVQIKLPKERATDDDLHMRPEGSIVSTAKRTMSRENLLKDARLGKHVDEEILSIVSSTISGHVRRRGPGSVASRGSEPAGVNITDATQWPQRTVTGARGTVPTHVPVSVYAPVQQRIEAVDYGDEFGLQTHVLVNGYLPRAGRERAFVQTHNRYKKKRH